MTSTIYENNDFRNEDIKKKLFENFFLVSGLSTLEKIIKNKTNSIKSNYDIIQSITLLYVYFIFVYL